MLNMVLYAFEWGLLWFLGGDGYESDGQRDLTC